MTELKGARFTRVEFHRFKAFKKFNLSLHRFNILVGPNNAGKSTILIAFRILAAAMRRARSRKAEIISGPNGSTYGYPIDLDSISVAEENLFFNYDDAEPATVRFKISNGNELLLYFPQAETGFLIAESGGRANFTPSTFKSHFNCQIGFVPILGPLEHNENLFEKEAARLALFNYRAARNFRNIWHHFPEKFEIFREALKNSWPGMDIERPTIERSHGRPRLHMFCPEQRIPREIFWAGFGFQVWCQMLTHIVQGEDTAIFLIDEPDIYLHSELQRQLISILRDMGPDILIATHSTEIISEAETDNIVLVNKERMSARRIKHPTQLEHVFSLLGSSLNPVLTQIARTRRVVFVEGQDFQLLSRFAQRLGYARVGNRSNFAVVPVEGFNPQRMENIKTGIETTLGGPIIAAAFLDRDYRCAREVESIKDKCKKFCEFVEIHPCKEIENFLLVPRAIDVAAKNKIRDRDRRDGRTKETRFQPFAAEVLDEFAAEKKAYVQGQHIASRQSFERKSGSRYHNATLSEEVLSEFEPRWENQKTRLMVLPGKDALKAINQHLEAVYGVSVTATAIVDAMAIADISVELRNLISSLDLFALKLYEAID